MEVTKNGCLKFETVEISLKELIVRLDVYWKFLEFCHKRFSDYEYCLKTWPEFTSNVKDQDLGVIRYNHIYHQYQICYKNRPMVFLCRDINIVPLRKSFEEETKLSFSWIPIECVQVFAWVQNDCYIKQFEQIYGKKVGEKLFWRFHDDERPWFLWWKELSTENRKFLISEYLACMKYEPLYMYQIACYSWIKIDYLQKQVK